MSRVAKATIDLPSGVELKLEDRVMTVKGPKGELSASLHGMVEVERNGAELAVKPKNDDSWAMAGTARALLNNMVLGVSRGFEKKLELVGVGYRAAVKGKTLNLNLGFSHPVEYPMPEGIMIETPSQTEILIKGIDKQRVGQVAAEIRAYRPPEPYKGKGVKYADENIIRKEAKKK